MPIFLIIYCFFTMIFTTGLLIYHSSLIWRNLTTKEELKSSFKNIYGNPYSRGLCGNIRKILCPRLNNPDILVKIREKISEKIIQIELKEKNETEKKELKNNINTESNKNHEININENNNYDNDDNDNYKNDIDKLDNYKANNSNENSDKVNEDKIYKGGSGINKTNSESAEYTKYQKINREKIYYDNNENNENDNNENNEIKNNNNNNQMEKEKEENLIDKRNKNIIQEEKNNLGENINKENNNIDNQAYRNKEIKDNKDNKQDKDYRENINISQSEEKKEFDSDLTKEICNSQIKVIFPQGKNGNEKSIDFNLNQSIEVNQEGVINSNMHESKIKSLKNVFKTKV